MEATNLMAQLLGELMASKQAAAIASNNSVLMTTIILGAIAPCLVALAGYFKAAAAAKHSVEASTASKEAKTASEDSKKVITETAATVGVIHTDVNSERTATLKLVDDLRKELLASKEEVATLRERATK